MRRRGILALTVCVCAVGAGTADARVVLKVIPSTGPTLTALAPAAHGRLWFSAGSGASCAIGVVDPDTGRRTAVPYPAGVACTSTIASSRSGALWLAAGSTLARVDAAGRTRTRDLDGEVRLLAVASDGAAWTTSLDASHVTRTSAAGRSTTFRLPAQRVPDTRPPAAIAAGTHGTVWLLRTRDVVSVDARGRTRRYDGVGGSAIATDARGRPWILGGGALQHLGPHGFRATAVTPPANTDSALIRDGTGRMRVVSPSARSFGAIGPDGRIAMRTVAAGRGPAYVFGPAASGDRLFAIGGANPRTLVEAVDRPVCWVPGVVGTTEAEARAALAANGCSAKVARGPVEPGVPAVVTSQSRATDAVGRRGAAITLTVRSPAACQAPAGAYEAYRSPTVVVYSRFGPTSEDGTSDPTVWSACLTAARVVVPFLTTNDGDGHGGDGLNQYSFASAGSLLVYEHWSGDAHDMDTTSTIELLDVAHGAPATVVGHTRILGTSGVTVEPGGNVAWVVLPNYQHAEIHVWHAGADRIVASLAAPVSSLSVDATTVSWSVNGVPGSAPVAAP